VLIVFELKVGEARGFMNFCIPAIVLEPISKRFSQDWYADKAKTSVDEIKKIKLNLLKTNIKLAAAIHGNTITARDLIGLKPGDVIKLESKVTDPLTIELNGVKKYNAYQVKQGEKKTVQVVELIPREFKNE
jgi:flagellar motor switch protein FliM